MRKTSSIGLLLGLSAVCCGQSKTAVSATAGYVAGVNTTASGGTWSGIAASAQTSTISYTDDLATGGLLNTAGAPTEFKMINAAGQFGPKIFNGEHAALTSSSGSASVAVDGHSYFMSGSGVGTYYGASWTATTQQSGDGLSVSGTYDPWTVHYSDLVNLGVPVGGTATLYYQTGLEGGFSASSGFDLAHNGLGAYTFTASATTSNQTLTFFSITDSSTGGLSAVFNPYLNFSVYLLGANAQDPNASPQARLGDAIEQITSSSQLVSVVSGDLNSDGSLIDDLNFGIFYSNVVLPVNYNPNGTVISWQSTTNGVVQTVPEPAPFAVLGVGCLGFLRRRLRKA